MIEDDVDSGRLLAATDRRKRGPGPVASSFGLVNFVPRNCPLATEITPIHEAQGTGAATPCPGEDITIEGVVVADFEGAAPTLAASTSRKQDADVDADPATSEALFVFNASNNSVSVGDKVRITGVVAEFQGQTQINFPDVLTILSTGNTLPTASTVTLPFAALDSLEAVEGMLVTIPQTLYVTEFFQLGRFGEVLVSGGDRLGQPTANRRARRAGAGDAGGERPEPADHRRRARTPRTPTRSCTAATAMPLTAAQSAARRRHHHRRDRRDDLHLGRQRGVAATRTGCGRRPDPIAFQTANPRPTVGPRRRRLVEDRQLQRPQLLPHARRRRRRLRSGREQAGVPRCRDGCGVPAPARQADGCARRPRRRRRSASIELENSEGVEPLAADRRRSERDQRSRHVWAYVDTGNIGTDTIRVGIDLQAGDRSSPLARSRDDQHERRSAVRRHPQPPVARPVFVEKLDRRSDDARRQPPQVEELRSRATGARRRQRRRAAAATPTRTAAAEALVDWMATHPTGVDDDDVLGDG